MKPVVASLTRVVRMLLIAACGACVSVAVCAAEARRMPLVAVLEALREQGHEILFSTDLVPVTLEVEIDEISLQALQATLPEVGLRLGRSARYWFVTQLGGGIAPPVRLRLATRDREPVTEVMIDTESGSVPVAVNGRGLFDVPLEPGQLVTVRAANYLPLQTTLNVGVSELLLEPLVVVENIIVTGTRHRLPGRSVTGSAATLLAEELSVVPALAGDAMRVATRLPGMSSVGVSARPRVRGGLQDELLVMVDGVELLDPYHLADFQSVFSTIDDRTVDAIDVYTGGFPARYGNRMSGVMEINTLQQADKPGTELGLSLFSLFANARRASPDADTQYLISARRGNLDLVAKEVDPKVGTPRYADAYGRVSRRLPDDAEVFVGAFYTRDDVTLKDDEERADSRINSVYVWTRLDVDHAPTLSSSSVLTYTGSRRVKKQFSPEEEEDSGFLDHEQRVRKYGLRSDWSYQPGGDVLIEFGAQAEFARSKYDSTGLFARGDLAVILGGEEISSHDIHTDPDGWAGGAYWSAELPLGKRFVLQPGVRWDFQDYDPVRGMSDHFSPRLGLKFTPSETMTFHLDGGRFHQPEGIQEMQVSDGVSGFFRPQRSDHLIFGWEWLVRDWTLRAELYSKEYRRPKLRFENLFNPFVILPELEPDRVGFRPDKARARGGDIEIRRALGDRATGIVRYSHMQAEDRIDGVWIDRRWSQRHTANVIAMWEGDSFTAAAALTWHTGWRSAVPPATLPVDETLPLTGILNNTELKSYLSFDLSLSKSWSVGRSTITAFADITNVFNRKNLAGIDFDVEEEDGTYVFSSDRETLMPLIPSVGVLIAF